MWGWQYQGLCMGLGSHPPGGGLGPSPGLGGLCAPLYPWGGPYQAHSYTLGGERFGRQPSSRDQLTQPFLASPKLWAVK